MCALTEADDTASAAGTLKVSAKTTINEAGNTVAVTGAGSLISGTANITEADDGLFADCSIRIPGSVNFVEDSDGVAASAVWRTEQL